MAATEFKICSFNENWTNEKMFNEPVLTTLLWIHPYDGTNKSQEINPVVRVTDVSNLTFPFYYAGRYSNEGQTFPVGPAPIPSPTPVGYLDMVYCHNDIVKPSMGDGGLPNLSDIWTALTNNGSLEILDQFTTSIPVPQGLAMGKLHSVQSVQFEAKDSLLDTCPNNGGNRIFPGKQSPTDTTDRSKVQVKARISPREQGIKVHFKSFDVDDPSSDTSPIDTNGPSGNDNRGNVNNKKEGELNAPFALTDINGIAEVELTVTMQPGDNFRVAASCNETILKNMTELATDEVRATDMLTVWRRLHVEVDSMGEVVNNNATGKIIEISKHRKRLKIGSTNLIMNGKGVTSLSDGSSDQGPPPAGNGRFENGTLTIGATPFTVASNGGKFLNMSVRVTLPFTIKKGSNIKEGKLIQLRKVANMSIIDVRNITMRLNEFKDGTITIAGVTYRVRENLRDKVFTERGNVVRIAFILHDDDNDTLLPKFPHIGLLDNALTPAYVRPVFDVGDNNLNVPFVANVPFNPSNVLAVQDRDSKSLNKDNFWVAYLLECFQDGVTLDNDPNSERTIFGATHSPNGGSLIFLEVHQTHEGIANPTIEEQDTVVHEVGHAVGRSADDDEPGVTDGVGNYTAKYLNYIRSSPHPWP